MEKQNIGTIFRVFLFGIFLLSSINIASTTSDFVNRDKFDIEYTYNANNSLAGERFELTITITNQDSKDKENVNFKLYDDTPFEIIGDDYWIIGNLATGESVTKNFRIEVDEDLDSNNYNMEFKVEDNEDEFKDEFKISVKSNKAEFIIGNLQSDPTTILPNMKDIKLTVNIQNSGDRDAKYVRAKLELPEGFSPSSSYSDISNLGIIKAGETNEAVFYINTEKILISDIYNAEIHLDFESDGDKKSKDLNINLPVQGIPQFSISNIETKPTKIIQGDSVILKIEIKNIGEKEGKDISIKVFEKSAQPFEFKEKTNYVGTLESGKSGTAVLKFDVDKNAVPTSYLLNIQIRTVYNGNVLVSEKSVPVKIYAYERTSGDYVKIGALIIGGLFGILILLLIIKRKK